MFLYNENHFFGVSFPLLPVVVKSFVGSLIVCNFLSLSRNSASFFGGRPLRLRCILLMFFLAVYTALIFVDKVVLLHLLFTGNLVFYFYIFGHLGLGISSFLILSNRDRRLIRPGRWWDVKIKLFLIGHLPKRFKFVLPFIKKRYS